MMPAGLVMRIIPRSTAAGRPAAQPPRIAAAHVIGAPRPVPEKFSYGRRSDRDKNHTS